MYIHVSKQNTYACINDTAISNPDINSTTANGARLATVTNPPAINIFHVNVANIANNRCPAVIFAANRTPSDIAFAVCDTISISIKNGANHNGVPAGRNIEKKFNW